MPRTQIPVDVMDHNGATFAIDSAADVANDNYFLNSGAEILVVHNAGASPVTVTLDFVADGYGRDGTKVHTVPNGTMRMIGPFPKDLYNQSGEQVHINASAACMMCVIRRA